MSHINIAALEVGQVIGTTEFLLTRDSLVRYAGGLEAEAQLQLYHAVDLRDEAKLRSPTA